MLICIDLCSIFYVDLNSYSTLFKYMKITNFVKIRFEKNYNKSIFKELMWPLLISSKVVLSRTGLVEIYF